MYDFFLIVLSVSCFLILTIVANVHRNFSYALSILLSISIIEIVSFIHNGYVDPFFFIAIPFAFPKSLLSIMATDLAYQFVILRKIYVRSIMVAARIAILSEFLPLLGSLAYIAMTHELQPSPEEHVVPGPPPQK